MNQNNIKPQDLRATDLRIGNWIADHNEEKRFFKVEQITYSDKSNVYYIHYNNGCTKCQVKYLDTIPLSEEVQKMLHEAESNYIAFDDKNIIIYSLNNREWWFPIECYPYLHQVQNLYFSIQLEELEVRWI